MQSEPSRLDRVESLVESNARAIQAMAETVSQFGQELTEFKQTVERDHEQVNAELQSLSRDVSRLVDIVAAAAQERHELREATLGIANLLASLDSDRPTILRKLNTIENKVDRLLESQS